MSTDETRPDDATSEPGVPADARSAGPDPAGPAAEPASGPTSEPASDAASTAPGQRPYPETGFFASIRRGLFPRSDRRWVGGVAGGLAERIGWDPLLVRGLLIVSFFLGGLGLILYGLGWALLPERDGRIHLQEATRGNFDVAMLGSVAVFLVGFAWGGPLGWWDNGGWEWLAILFWMAVLGVTAYLIVQGVQRHRDTTRQASYHAGTPAPGTPPPGTPAPGTPVAGAAAPGAAATGTPGPATPGATGTGAPAGPGAATAFTPAPQADYRRSEGLVYATGAGPAPSRQPQHRPGPPPTPQLVYTAPPVRTRRGPGGAAVGLSLGLILLAGALVLAAGRVGPARFLDGDSLAAAWLGISTVVLGVAILVSALRGRTSGVLGFFAIVALIFGLGYIALFGSDRGYWVDEAVTSGRHVEDMVAGSSNPDAATLTEGTVTVQTLREAEDGFYVQWGDPVIDLSELDLSRTEPGTPVVVPIELGAGQTVVMVPQDVPVEANAYVAAGVVQWNVDEQDRAASGVGTETYFASDEVGDDGAVLSLDIRAGAGEVIVSETQGRSTP